MQFVPVRAQRASSLVVRAEAEKAATKKEEKPYIGPKRGAVVSLLTWNSRWFVFSDICLLEVCIVYYTARFVAQVLVQGQSMLAA